MTAAVARPPRADPLAVTMLEDPFDAALDYPPYPGLRPFSSAEWPIFFGRETMTDEIIDLVTKKHLVVVHGDSGSGKSSIVRAGVLVQLQQGHAATDASWRTCAMLPREDPLGNLADALAGLLADEPTPDQILDVRHILNRGRRAPRTLARRVRRGKSDHICILVDQFEELFTFAKRRSPEETRLFVDVLVGLQENPTRGLYAILTMRSEFLGHCARYEGLAEAVNKTQYLLPRMERPALLRAICEPAPLYRGEVSQELAERLIVDAGGQQDQLPLIQHGLMRLWRRKSLLPEGLAEAGVSYQHDGFSESPTRFEVDEAPPSFRPDGAPAWRLGLEDYWDVGGLATLLSDHADAVMAQAAPDDRRRRIVEHLFRALTDINAEGQAIRRPQTFAELAAVTGSEEQTLEAIINYFRADGVSFLAPYGDVPIGSDTLIDISHEALIRRWQKLADTKDGWLQREFDDGLTWKSLRMQARKHETLSAAATDDRDGWLQKLPSEYWCKRYGGDWSAVQDLMGASRKARDEQVILEVSEARRREAEERVRRYEEVAAQKERLREEQRRRADDAIASQRRQRRWTMAALVTAMIAIVAAAYAWTESQRADWEALDAQRAQAEAEAQRDAARDANAMAEEERVRADHAVLEAKNALREQEISSSKMFAALADNATARGDTAEALRLALRGLPKTLADIANWPDTPEAGAALIRAARQQEFEKLFLTGHNDSVWSVAFSPDGTRLASGSSDHTVRLWDAASGKETARLEGHGAAVRSVAFSPDGTRLASGSDDTTVRLWDVASGQETARLEGHGRAVNSVAFSPDGTRLASGSDDTTVRLWDVPSGKETARLEGHGRAVNSVAFSPDGTRLASGSDDTTVRLWDVASGQETARLEGHDGSVWSVAFSPDGTRLASGSDDTTVRLWDVARRQETARLEGHDGSVWSVAFSPNGTRLASGSSDHTVRLWDVASGKETTRLEGHGRAVNSVAFSPDGTRLASGSDDTTVRLWDVASGQETARLEGPGAAVLSVAFSPDGTRLASGSDDTTVRLWDVASGQETARLEGHDGSVWSVAFSPDGTRLASGSDDTTVRLWDVASGKETARLEGHGAGVRSVAFSPDGTRLASGSDDTTVRLWDVASGKETARLEGHGAGVRSVAFSPDGTRLASGSDDTTVRLWDVASGKETARLEGHGAGVRSVAFSPDGTRLASGSDDTTVRLWDVASGKETARLEGHRAGVRSVAFSPDGTRLASGSDDTTVRLWDVASGQETARLEGPGAAVLSVAFSPNGTRLASGSSDHTVRLWDVASGQETARLEGYGDMAGPVAFSPDGTRLASGSADKTVRLWRNPDHSIADLLAMAASGEEIAEYARQGQIDRAFDQLKWFRLDPRQRPITAETLNSVCWNGALEGHAERVLDTCEEAVSKAPDAGNIRDSRGVALALTGDLRRAVEDFEAFVAWGPDHNRDDAVIQQRLGWIDALRKGQNPLTPELLKQLKGRQRGGDTTLGLN